MYAQVQPATAPATTRPDYQMLRYEEDWSFLRDDNARSDIFDSWKYVSLPARLGYLTIGGEARERYEYFSEFAFGAGPQDDNGYALQRYLLNTDWHPIDRVRVFTQVQSGIANGRNGGPRLTDDDRFELHQAFVDFRLGDRHRSLTIRVGRHEMDFGAGRLISSAEGLNVRRSFDGVRLIFKQSNWIANIQVDKLTSVKPGVFNDSPDPAQTFWGGGATRTRKGGAYEAAYYIGIDRKIARFERGVGREIRHSIGFRSSGAFRRYDYGFDVIGQWGVFRPFSGEVPIRAAALAADLGYNVAELPMRPRFGAHVDLTSGDDPRKRTLRTFNPLFPATSYSDIIGLIGAPNSTSINGTVRLMLSRKIVVNNGVAAFFRRSRYDGVYGINVAPLRTGSLSRDRHVGTMPFTRWDWRASRHLSYTLMYAYFQRGLFLEQTPPGKSTQYLTVWGTFRF